MHHADEGVYTIYRCVGGWRKLFGNLLKYLYSFLKKIRGWGGRTPLLLISEYLENWKSWGGLCLEQQREFAQLGPLSHPWQVPQSHCSQLPAQRKWDQIADWVTFIEETMGTKAIDWACAGDGTRNAFTTPLAAFLVPLSGWRGLYFHITLQRVVLTL